MKLTTLIFESTNWVIGKKYSYDELMQRDISPYVNNAVLTYIPVNKITGRDPTPGDWTDEEGNVQQFTKGSKESNIPIQVKYDKNLDEFILFDGNHRLHQSEINGSKYILALVASDKGMFGLKHFKNRNTITS